MVVCTSRTLPRWGNIPRLAIGSRAAAALRRECEPYSATTLQSKGESILMVHHAKKPPFGVALRGGNEPV